MNVFAFSSLLVFITTLLIAIFVFRKRKDIQVSNAWSLLCFAVSMWGLGGFKFSTTTSKESAFFWWQMTYITVILIPVLYYRFVLALLRMNKKQLLSFLYILAGMFIVINIFNRRIFLGDLRFVFNQFYTVDWTKYYSTIYLIFYIGFYWLLLLYSFSLLIKHYHYTKGLRRNQLKYVILGSIIAWIGPHGYFPLIFGFDIYPYSNFLIAIYPIIFTYAIIRHQLMEIEVIIRRAVVFAGVFGFVFSVFVATTIFGQQIIADVFGITNRWLMTTLAVLIVTLSYGALRNFLLGVTDRFLFQKKYDYQKILKEASVGMAQVTDLRKLLSLIVHVVSSKLRTNQTSILLFDEDTNTYKLALSRGQNKLAGTLALEANNPLLTHLAEKKEPLSLDDVQYKLQDQRLISRNHGLKESLEAIKTQLQELKCQLCVPAFIKEKLLGVLILGEKLSRDLYSQTDLALLSTLFNQGGIAIENALTFEKLRHTREELFHFEKLAYVGNLASSVVHEIKNPLTVIKTYIEYFPKKFQDADFREKFYKTVSQEINRMNNTVHQLLDLSKPRGLVMKLVDISEIIDTTLVALENEFSKRNISVVKDYLPKQPYIQADSDYLKQVFLNLFLNSISAMDKQPPDKQLILSIKTSYNTPDYFDIEISDTGCGISEENIRKLFTPFFTTKEEGIGLGLVITSEIIKNHEGKIGVKSKLGEGTTFMISLPVVK